MNSSLFFSTVCVFGAVIFWHGMARRIAQDVAEWEITPQQGRTYLFMYRFWSMALAFAGVTVAVLAFLGK